MNTHTQLQCAQYSDFEDLEKTDKAIKGHYIHVPN